jgi:hypothetical protein
MKYPEIPELLEQYMESACGTARWVTVEEFRDHFNLDPESGSGIAGFLRRIYKRPFRTYPYIVTRQERLRKPGKKMVMINRYLVKRRETLPARDPGR